MIEIEVEAGEAEMAANEGTLNIPGFRRRIIQGEWQIRQTMELEARWPVVADLARDRRDLERLKVASRKGATGMNHLHGPDCPLNLR